MMAWVKLVLASITLNVAFNFDVVRSLRWTPFAKTTRILEVCEQYINNYKKTPLSIKMWPKKLNHLINKSNLSFIVLNILGFLVHASIFSNGPYTFSNALYNWKRVTKGHQTYPNIKAQNSRDTTAMAVNFNGIHVLTRW
jgi:hypothetical protein